MRVAQTAGDEVTLNMRRVVKNAYCADPRLVIKAMMTQEDYNQFILKQILTDRIDVHHIYMDRTGKLAKLAIEWIERRGHEPNE